MEFIKCNDCCFNFEGNQSLFHLTQCGHVYCNKCIVKAEEKCVQCGSVGTISLPLKEPLNPQISHYFTRPPELMEKVIQAYQFQESQLAICLKRSDAKDTKYESLKQAYWACSENFKKVLQKYNKLKAAVNNSLKEQKSASSAAQAQFRTPPTSQLRIPKHSQRGSYAQKAIDSAKHSNQEVFRVPSVTRVPRSAGYYSASSTSSVLSNARMATPQSNFSRY